MIWQLFISFFIIGLINFGGGGAMLSLIYDEVVTQHGWISDATFTDIVGISQSTPGPIGINCATYVGYEVSGILGSIVATSAVVLPSFIVFFLIIALFKRFHRSRSFSDTMSALKPAVAGLIAAAAFLLIANFDNFPNITILQANFPDLKSWLLFAAALILSIKTKLSPIVLIFAGGVIGIIIC